MGFGHLKTAKPDFQTERILAAIGDPAPPPALDEAELDVLAFMAKSRR